LPLQVRHGVIAIVVAISLTGCASVSFETRNAREERPFFQREQETEIHGRKNWLDYLVETDPGTFEVETAWTAMEFSVVPFEERRLEQRWGDAYREYRRQVPRWIGSRAV
jgi:protein-S-isoprenylcysteine O-methyltransferase Ste14